MSLSVQDYLRLAYGVPPYLMADVPNWAANERFDIEGVLPSGVRLIPTVQENGTVKMEPPALAALLVDRFALRFRFEKREVPVYELWLARADGRLGPKLQRVEVDCKTKAVLPPPCSFGFRTGGYTAKGMMWGQFASMIAGDVGRPIVDRTELAGQFDLDVQWDPEPLSSSTDPVENRDSRVSIFTAFREQLGLKLEPARGLADVMVIEHLEHPTEN